MHVVKLNLTTEGKTTTTTGSSTSPAIKQVTINVTTEDIRGPSEISSTGMILNLSVIQII